MITRKTVLVLGAGASYPYGFPLGSELIDRICTHPTHYIVPHPGFNDHGAKLSLHPSFEDQTAVERFRKDLRDSALFSIDAFLTARPDYSEIGKAAIAAALVPMEILDRLNTGTRGGNWYAYLRNQMGESYEEFCQSAKNLSIITFNYDRSFEYFFFSALSASYGESRALDAIRLIKIIHAYGQLGNPYFLSEEGRLYTTELNRDVIAKCVKEIKVIPEDRDGAIEFQDATQVIKSSNVVCFLGFGYNATNVKRLQCEARESISMYYGTLFGMKDTERNKAISLLQQYIDQNYEFHHMAHYNFGKEDEDALLFLRTYPVLV